MASTQIIKRRIRSVKNTKQITKAMELVAASRLRRVQEAARASKAYAATAYTIMHRVGQSADLQQNVLFASKPTAKRKLYVVFTTDIGKAGAFDSNVINAALKAIRENEGSGSTNNVIAYGRKGTHFFARLKEVELIGTYDSVADSPDPTFFAPVLNTILNGMKDGTFDAVEVFYMGYTSTLSQKVVRLPLLPITFSADTQPETGIVYEFEPSPEVVLERAAQLYLDSQIMQARIESAASEYAMRMIAMGNANKNAGEIIDDLTLELNATRQAAITQEIAEITGGAAAIA
jgi:F-type H+-transporting ATPase subunit gamma